MIHYLAPGNTKGWGVATRAAAICRWLPDVHVYCSANTEPLELHGIPHTVAPPQDLVGVEFDGFVIADGTYNPRFRADAWIWRQGRDVPRDCYIVYVEPTGFEHQYFWPIVRFTDDEILTREQARDELGWDPDAVLTAKIPSKSGTFDAEHDVVLDRYPAMKYLRAADHVVAACGANTWAEVHQLGIPATWHAVREEQHLRLTIPQSLWQPIPDASKAAAAYVERLAE